MRMSLKNLLNRLIREGKLKRMVRLYLSDKDPQLKLFRGV